MIQLQSRQSDKVQLRHGIIIYAYLHAVFGTNINCAQLVKAITTQLDLRYAHRSAPVIGATLLLRRQLLLHPYAAVVLQHNASAAGLMRLRPHTNFVMRADDSSISYES